MKKIYSTPVAEVIACSVTSHILEESKVFKLHDDEEVSEGLVKDQKVYNVWDDDWSKAE